MLHSVTFEPKGVSIQEEYFVWLGEKVGLFREGESYWLLGRALHKKAFYWTVPNDDNREEDGKMLRYEFMAEHSYPQVNYIDGQVSVLEVLIALAMKIEVYQTEDSSGTETSEWFWIMLGNLGLVEYTDKNYANNSVAQVEEILNMFLDRSYDQYGNGSLFPIPGSKKDLRTVEIWYQVSQYIIEFYMEDDFKL